jgi:hypothetical protein
MSNPGIDHWHALERVMRYLCGTMSYEIHYTIQDTPLCLKDIVTQIGSLM